MNFETLFIVAAVVAFLAVIGLVVSLVAGSRSRHKMMKEYEDAEDALQERITALSSEKASIEGLLAAREEYETRLKEDQERAMKAQREEQARLADLQKEQYEKNLESMRDAFKEIGRAHA